MATRRERVVLELEDAFTSRMARAAAITAVLNKELDSLSRESVKTQRSFSDIDRSTGSFGRSADKAGSQIDRLSGRLRVLTDVATLLAPAGIAVGAVAVPAVTALASQLGFAALAGGTAVIAFQGIGDALKALDKAALDPTRENLEAANLAMQKLSPAARQFAQEVRDLIPEAQRLRDVAAEGLFPGVVAGLEQLETALPRVESIVAAVSQELGNIAADTGASLASDRWAPFLEFIAREAPQALADMAAATGNVAHGLASMWMAFEPLNDDFSNWLVEATADLDRWASGLSQTQGFHEFVDFIEENGPRVADTFGAIANAVIQVVEAAAPLSGPVLQGIEALANAVAALADSDLGTPLFTAAAALALFNRTMAVAVAGRNGLQGFQTRLGGVSTQARGLGTNLRTTAGDFRLLSTTAMTAGARTEREMLRMNAASARLKANLAPLGKGAAVLGGLGIAATGAADGIGLTNTASLAMLGTLGGPWGIAIGAAIGGVKDLGAALSTSEDSIRRYQETLLATAGPNVRDQLAAINAEIEKQQQILEDTKHDLNWDAYLGPLVDTKTESRLGALKDTQAELKHQLELEAIAAKRAGTEIRGTAQATDAYGRAVTAVGTDATNTAGQIDSLIKSMREQRQEALSAFDAETRFRQALKDARAQAAASNAGIKGDSEEALKNRAVIDQLASAWNSQSEAVKNNVERFKAARAAFVETAVGMGVPIEQAKRLAKRLLELPEQKVIGVKFDSVNALNAIKRIKDQLKTLPRSVRTDYYVNQVNAFNKPKILPGSQTYAVGGWTGPGAKYQPAGVVHADEFVFSKEATNGNVAFLDALHRQLRGYADGGLVRRMPMASAPAVSLAGGGTVRFSDSDIDRIAGALAAVRPMFGDVHLSGDGSFAREQRERKLSGLDGVRR